MSTSLLQIPTAIPAPFDPGFAPAILGNRGYAKAARESSNSTKMIVALERTDGCVARRELDILAPGSDYDADTIRYLERSIKCLIWAHGGSVLYLNGPARFSAAMAGIFSETGKRLYDARRMEIVYDAGFKVRIASEKEIPEARHKTLSLGGHLDGCRIGFDLGASDYKLAAVIDGEPVFSTEIPWNPGVEKDPAYHYEHINNGLKEAAKHMPRVDAIGGSAAGAYVDNQVKYASLFRSVPEKAFKHGVKPLFLNLQREWNVPLDVLNDGAVTALAGAMSLGKNAFLGLAMGSSEASGYVDADGLFTGDYTALAYIPIDYNPEAAADEPSGDIGCGALYFSQQAVNRLAPSAGFTFPDDMHLRERLKAVQEKAEQGDANARDIFAAIGVYLGYTLPFYSELMPFENVLVLGRVTSGVGGEIMVEKTRMVLEKEFPDMADRIALHVPDEKSRRVGQAVAAASLPRVTKG